ncbi:MAG: sulfatase-like hydrolase/transferase [Planctomycetota bacterium]|jgi:phosphoglycerol transferase|nr:sulfatase-like hydrolase/transferase [Planctomycetota bacterium]
MRKIIRPLCLAATLLFFFLGVELAAVLHWTTERFETANLELIITYMVLPIGTVDPQYIYSLVSYLALGFLATAWLGLFLVRRGGGSAKPRPFPWRPLALPAAFLVFSGSLFAWEARYRVWENLFPDAGYYSYVEDNFHLPDPGGIVFPERKNNLILLILESVETTMNDEAVFKPKLMPRLEKFYGENLSFGGYRLTTGTQTSILSFFSTNLGMPFLGYKFGFFRWDPARDGLELEALTLGRTENKKKHDFRDRSLLGIMEKNGYHLEVIRAASIQFADYDKLIAMSTDRCGIYDFDYFHSRRPDCPEKMNNWGVDDSYLYARARERLLAVQKLGKPFFQIIQTVNTHPPGFYEKNLPAKYGDYRDSFEQADLMAGEFLEWIGKQTFAGSTTVIVVGDHNLSARGVGAIRIPLPENREIMNFFINPRREPERGVRRLYAAWDLAPTILEAVGAEIPGRRLGLGTSLFSGRDTLLERDGLDKYEEMIKKRSRLYEQYYYWW